MLPELVFGGLALAALGFWCTPAELGLGTRRLAFRLLGGLVLGGVLLLPASLRSAAVPALPAPFAAAAVVVSVGEEIAFRGALFAALRSVAGAPVAIVGTSLLFALAHVLSHPTAFLLPVFAAGLLLALWRWAFDDLVGPIVGHTLADLAL